MRYVTISKDQRKKGRGTKKKTSMCPFPDAHTIHLDLRFPGPFFGQRTEHVKTGHVKTDCFRGHFRGHVRGHPRGTFRGAFRGECSKGWNREVSVRSARHKRYAIASSLLPRQLAYPGGRRSRGRFRGPTRGHTRGPTRGVKFRSSGALCFLDFWPETLGLPSLQKCVCEIFGEIWFGIRFEIWNFRWEKSGEIFGEDFSTCQESMKNLGGNFGANFGANFGENFGNFVSNFAAFFGNFVQQKGGAKETSCININ